MNPGERLCSTVATECVHAEDAGPKTALAGESEAGWHRVNAMGKVCGRPFATG